MKLDKATLILGKNDICKDCMKADYYIVNVVTKKYNKLYLKRRHEQ